SDAAAQLAVEFQLLLLETKQSDDVAAALGFGDPALDLALALRHMSAMAQGFESAFQQLFRQRLFLVHDDSGEQSSIRVAESEAHGIRGWFEVGVGMKVVEQDLDQRLGSQSEWRRSEARVSAARRRNSVSSPRCVERARMVIFSAGVTWLAA